MQKSKVTFSTLELAFMANSEMILTKNAAINKVYEAFGELSTQYREYSAPLLHKFPEVFNTIPKISKGENYLHLPWVMLDYPRCFDTKNGFFAIRTFFWWGNGFTWQMILSGNNWEKFYASDVHNSNHPSINCWDVQIIAEDELWQHHLPLLQQNNNIVKLKIPPQVSGKYLRISQKTPLLPWAVIHEWALKNFQTCVQLGIN